VTTKKPYTICGFPIERLEPVEADRTLEAVSDIELCEQMISEASPIGAHIEWNRRGYHALTCENTAGIYEWLLEGTDQDYKPAIKRTIKRLKSLGSKIIHPRLLKNAERQYWEIKDTKAPTAIEAFKNYSANMT